MFSDFKDEWPHATVKEHLRGSHIGLIVAHPRPGPYLSNVWQSFSNVTWFLIILCLLANISLKALIYIYYQNIFEVGGKLLFQKSQSMFINVIFNTVLSFTESIDINWFERYTVGKIK